jgi:hypothetical protein
MFQTNVVEKIKTHILCSVIFFFGNRAVYEIVWKNIVERDRPQIENAVHAHCTLVPTIIATHSECVIFIAITLQQWLRERAAMLCCTYIACLVCESLFCGGISFRPTVSRFSPEHRPTADAK